MRLRLFDDMEQQLKRVRKVGDNYVFHHPRSDEKIEDYPGEAAVKHYGLWNENTATLTRQRPLATPAVFVEFFPITWSEVGNRASHGDVIVRFHIVTATLAETDTPYRAEALARFRLIRAIKNAFARFGGAADSEGRSYSTFQYYESTTDHNHEQICEDLEGWRTHCTDCSSTINDGYIMTDKNVTLDTGDIFADPFDDKMV